MKIRRSALAAAAAAAAIALGVLTPSMASAQASTVQPAAMPRAVMQEATTSPQDTVGPASTTEPGLPVTGGSGAGLLLVGALLVAIGAVATVAKRKRGGSKG